MGNNISKLKSVFKNETTQYNIDYICSQLKTKKELDTQTFLNREEPTATFCK
jgi:hypothetical protein